MLYPLNEWTAITAQLESLKLFVARNRRFYRQFHTGATPLNLDGNARLLLPKPLMTFAEISKEVILFAYSNRIEVWDKARYEAVMSEDLDDFADLAEEVMGTSGMPDVD